MHRNLFDRQEFVWKREVVAIALGAMAGHSFRRARPCRSQCQASSAAHVEIAVSTGSCRMPCRHSGCWLYGCYSVVVSRAFFSRARQAIREGDSAVLAPGGYRVGKRLYVGGLSYDTSDEGLRDHFARIGSVESATVARDRYTGRSRGFGFVEMDTEADAQKAIADLNGQDLDGRRLTVDEAKPRPDSGGRRFD